MSDGPGTATDITHEVTNQAPPLDGYDPLACDPALAEALRAHSAENVLGSLAPIAWEAGSPAVREHARLANENPPTLRSHDRYGHRVDEVEFHPSWHVLMGRAVSHGLHAAPWNPDAGKHAHLARASRFYLWAQA
jgi:putative acyl-CoA dehydrogenase